MVFTKKRICVLISAVAVSFSGITFGTLINHRLLSQTVFGEGIPTSPYSMIFSSTTNKLDLGDGVSNAYTRRGGLVRFAHQGLSSSSHWHKISHSGYLKNVDPINGLKYISIDFSSNNNAKFNISYGSEDDMVVQTQLSSGQLYSFNNDNPSYFRIDNLSGEEVDISNIEIGYSCSPSANPDMSGTFVSEIKDDKYVIDVKSLNLNNIQNAYEHAINLNESQLDNLNEILINLPSGSINLNETLSFSGLRKNNTPIRILGDHTTIYGGEEIAKGNWVSYQNGIYRTYIGTNLDKFSSLIVNGEAKTLARTNDLTFTYSYDNRKISFKKSQYDLSSMEGTCEIVTLERWAQCIGVVESYSKSGVFTVTFTLNLDTNGQYIYYDTSVSYRPTSTTEIKGYLQDNLSFLDEVGEWYYSKTDGYLYYKPENASSINSDTFIIPKVETVLSTENLVDNITFDGITFSGSNYARPLEVGFFEMQTSWFLDPATQSSDLMSGMVEVQSERTQFTNCLFKNSSNIGVHINTACKDITLYNNQVISSGAGAVYVGYPSSHLFGAIPQNINIENNAIDNFGYFYKGGPGICAAYVDGLDIINNTINNGGYSGIAAGWGWLNNQSTYGHGRYHISYNRISNVMNSAFHDGGGIYVLGNFPNQLNEIFNEISYNYIEVNYLLNGGIYLDEGSSSWDVHDNVINVTANNLTHHGVIMMHDPINTENISQFANHITNNYYRGDVDGSENLSQLSYPQNSSYYTGDQLAAYNNQRDIIFETPISGNETYVKDDIYNVSGHQDSKNVLFSNNTIFNKYIEGTTNLTLDAIKGQATFNVTEGGFVFTSNYISFLLNHGYSGISLNINATSLNSTEAVYTVCFTSGTMTWEEFYTQSHVGNNILIPLNKFKEGSTCVFKIRDYQGLGADNNLPARVTISNLQLSSFSTLKTAQNDDISLIYSTNNVVTYSLKNISYNWTRILFGGMKDALKKSYSKVRISIKGNNHNMYVFKSGSDEEVDYNHRILVGGGSAIIDLDNNDKNIAMMTSHENYDGSQDDAGQYGQVENLTITLKFIKSSYEEMLFTRNLLSKYISGIALYNLENENATISFINCTMRLNHALIAEMIESGVSSIEFDLIIPNDSEVKSIVTCWFGGPNNTDVSYDSAGVFYINNNVIHIILRSNKFNSCYDIQLVSRDANAYGGVNTSLENAIMTNLIFN